MAPAGYPTGFFERIRAASVNTLRGLTFAFRSERAFRQEVALLVIGTFAGIFIAPSIGWYAGMIGVLLLAISVELLNTSVEKLADHVMPDRHPQIAIVKDCGSAAVGCTLVLAGLVWLAALVVRLSA